MIAFIFAIFVAQIFATFAMRMGLYAAFSALRAALGYGGIGRVIRRKETDAIAA
jgi:hypothetical protein